MANKKIYVWYSPATDVTGKNIMEALDATGGTTKPPAEAQLIICWGTKIKDPVNLGAKTVVNNPNLIADNRNKYKALTKFANGGVRVAAATNDFAKAGTKEFPYPLVARTTFHQGGKGFWLCLNKTMLANAQKEGAQYIQNVINIKDEYRLHVVDGVVVYAVKKVQRENHQDAFVDHYTEYVNTHAAKNNLNFDANTVQAVLRKIAPKLAPGADMIVRSNTRGWKFSSVKVENLDKALVDAAIKAVKAIGLDFAAVDCCIDEAGNATIIECNSGPGLEGTSLEAWTKALKKIVEAKGPKKAAPVAEAAAKPGIVGGAVPAAPANGPINAAAQGAGVKAGGKKEQLKAKADLLKELIEAADDDEAGVIENLFAKIAAKKG